jgi:hypothetical protein
MGHKVFVSYKYKDGDVRSLQRTAFEEYCHPTTVRSYVDALQTILSLTNHQNKGETDDEDLSDYSEDYIWELLKDRIYDSSVTIVMISPNMKEPHRRDASQWIPWEISFSLKEKTRSDRTSHANAVLAVILPDRNGSYTYFVEHYSCCSSNCNIFRTDKLFSILGNNMFNIKEKNLLPCSHGMRIYRGESSYINPVRWDDFIQTPNSYIEQAIAIKENANAYEIQKEV